MIDSAVAGSAPFLPVRLVVFPEFAHAAPVFATVEELLRKLAVPIPNEHTERLEREGARARASTSRAGRCSKPIRGGRASSSTRRASSDRRALLYRYRKVNPWIPYEVHASPHDLDGLRRAAVSGRRHADRPDRLRDLLRLAVSGGDPPAGRERRRSARARVGLHGSVGRDRADELVDARQPLPRAREHRPSSSRPTRARACGTTRRIRGPAAVRSWTSTAACWPKRRPGPASASSSRRSTSRRCATNAATRRGHHMLAHLRTEAYPVYGAHRLSASHAHQRRSASRTSGTSSSSTKPEPDSMPYRSCRLSAEP